MLSYLLGDGKGARREGTRSRPDVRRLALRIGIAAPLLWMALIAWGDLYRPDIDAVTDYISELGERGSSTAGIFGGVGYAWRMDIVPGLAAAGFLLLLTWENNPIPAVGLWERLATAALSIWLIVFSRRWQRQDEDRVSRQRTS